jgi:negative regulator of flagellin synthesis FlgM
MSYASGIGSLQQTINSVTPSEAKPSIRTSASDGQANEKLVATDQTNLSSTSGLVAQALESSDTRSAKVTSLQQAIATGSYNVPSSGVADKIIQSLLD